MARIKLSNNFIKSTVKLALNEDLYPLGDITSNLIKNKKNIKIKLISNQKAIVGGLLFAKEAFKLIDNKIFSNGGRVLSIVASGSDYSECRKQVYEIAEMIDWPEKYYRSDIGANI